MAGAAATRGCSNPAPSRKPAASANTRDSALISSPLFRDYLFAAYSINLLPAFSRHAPRRKSASSILVKTAPDEGQKSRQCGVGFRPFGGDLNHGDKRGAQRH